MDKLRDLLISYTLLPWLTPSRTRTLLHTFGNLAEVRKSSTAAIAALLNLSRERARVVRDPLQVTDIRRIVSEWRTRVIALTDPDYPSLLREIPDPPTALFVEGDRSCLGIDSVAIVGSRKASRYGIAAAEFLSRALSTTGLVITSGLARGVDTAAHRAALDAGGRTIGVLGTGIDIVYPRSNAALFKRILDSDGLLISELPPGSPPRPSNFPIRNRIISGLSLGVVVVEATARSGSLITARMAAEQNRELFVVPGSIFSPASEGPHRLAQYGAKLVHDVGDILEELGLDTDQPTARGSAPRSGPGRRIADLLTPDQPVHIDTLVSELGMNVGEITVTLLDLQDSGLVVELPGDFYALKP